jgi:hypothetical protein
LVHLQIRALPILYGVHNFMSCTSLDATQCQESFKLSSYIIQQVLQIIIIPSLPPRHGNLLLRILVLGHSTQQLLQLFFGHLVGQLSGPCQSDQAILDARGTRLFHESYTTQAVGGLGGQDLREQRGAHFGFAIALFLSFVVLGGAWIATAATATLLAELGQSGFADLCTCRLVSRRFERVGRKTYLFQIIVGHF